MGREFRKLLRIRITRIRAVELTLQVKALKAKPEGLSQSLGQLSFDLHGDHGTSTHMHTQNVD